MEGSNGSGCFTLILIIFIVGMIFAVSNSRVEEVKGKIDDTVVVNCVQCKKCETGLVDVYYLGYKESKGIMKQSTCDSLKNLRNDK